MVSMLLLISVSVRRLGGYVHVCCNPSNVSVFLGLSFEKPFVPIANWH